MVAFANISGSGTEIGFQDTEAILDFVPAGANIKDFDCILMFSAIQIGSNGIVAIVFLFFLNNGLVNIVVVSCFLTVFTGRFPLNESGHIIGTFLNHFRIFCFEEFLCPLNLSVTDVPLVFHHFPGESHNNILLQLSGDFLDRKSVV